MLIAASISYWISVLFNFFLNRQWTFQTKQNLRKHLFLYAILLGFNFVITLLIIFSLGKLHISYAIAKIVAVAVQVSWNYFIYKYWIFTEPIEADLRML